MYELMVIGAGPAGLAASVYAARKRLDVLLISGDIGGQVNLTMGIENYLGYQFIGGPELMAKFQEQVRQFPIAQEIGYKVERLSKVEGGLEAAVEGGKTYQAKAVVFATGKRSKRLNVPGETEYVGRGVSYCAICDGPIFAGRRVAIVGGGNSAVSVALDMARIAEHVDLVSLTQLTCDTVLAEKLAALKNVTTFLDHQTERIEGDGFVKAITIRDVRTGETKRLEVAAVFIEIGLVPNAEPVRDLLNLNELGEVPINCMCETEVRGLYAAGDVTNVPEKQIIIAAGEGAKAALQAHRYLQGLPS